MQAIGVCSRSIEERLRSCIGKHVELGGMLFSHRPSRTQKFRLKDVQVKKDGACLLLRNYSGRTKWTGKYSFEKLQEIGLSVEPPKKPAVPVNYFTTGDLTL